jgi:protein-S-isoprenylcysteine O-methyltransferase Ste14
MSFLLTVTYVMLARREEKGLLSSRLGEAYRVYRDHTGFMLPRVPTQ